MPGVPLCTALVFSGLCAICPNHSLLMVHLLLFLPRGFCTLVGSLQVSRTSRNWGPLHSPRPPWLLLRPCCIGLIPCHSRPCSLATPFLSFGASTPSCGDLFFHGCGAHETCICHDFARASTSVDFSPLL